MAKNLSAATTRTRSLTVIASARQLLLTQSEVIESPGANQSTQLP